MLRISPACRRGEAVGPRWAAHGRRLRQRRVCLLPHTVRRHDLSRCLAPRTHYRRGRLHQRPAPGQCLRRVCRRRDIQPQKQQEKRDTLPRPHKRDTFCAGRENGLQGNVQRRQQRCGVPLHRLPHRRVTVRRGAAGGHGVQAPRRKHYISLPAKPGHEGICPHDPELRDPPTPPTTHRARTDWARGTASLPSSALPTGAGC